MPPASFTSTFDVAELAFYVFVLFFLALVFYLRREDKREGYPLEFGPLRPRRPGDRAGLPVPARAEEVHPAARAGGAGGTARARPFRHPRARADNWPGAPLVPARRSDAGRRRIRLLRRALRRAGRHLRPARARRSCRCGRRRATTSPNDDPDPRGMEVVAPTAIVAGTVADVWIDRSETFVHFLEVDVAPFLGAQRPRALVPIRLARIDAKRRRVTLKSVLARPDRGGARHQGPGADHHARGGPDRRLLRRRAPLRHARARPTEPLL